MTDQAPTPQDCIVAQDCQQIKDLSKDMKKAIRQLRNHLRQCDSCPHLEDCPTLAQVNATINAEILAINDEWNLASVVIYST